MDMQTPDYAEAVARMTRAFGLEGSRLRIDDGSGVRLGDDGILRFGGSLVFGPDARAIVHEFGHLMVAPDEGVGSGNWGMADPYLFVSGGVIYHEGHQGGGAIRHECRAWAWQWLLDERLGLATPSSEPPAHPEARFIDGWLGLGETETEGHATVGGWISDYKEKVLAAHPDPIASVRRRVSDVGRLLERRREIQATLESEGTVIETRTNSDDTVVHLCEHVREETTAYSVAINTGLDSRVVVETARLSRARAFMDIVAGLNGLEPARSAPALTR